MAPRRPRCAAAACTQLVCCLLCCWQLVCTCAAAACRYIPTSVSCPSCHRPQAIEAAFKNETVGLVTREQFVEKRQTIEERLKEEEKRRRHEAEEEALRVRRFVRGGVLGDAQGCRQGRLHLLLVMWGGSGGRQGAKHLQRWQDCPACCAVLEACLQACTALLPADERRS